MRRLYDGVNTLLGDKRDVVVLDVDSKDPSVGMSCPPQAFIQPQFLQDVNKILTPQGK